MKKKQKEELHEKTVDEIQTRIRDTKNDLFSVSIAYKQGKEKNVKKVYQLRKDLARMYTILQMKGGKAIS